jgi:hypothetical protein
MRTPDDVVSLEIINELIWHQHFAVDIEHCAQAITCCCATTNSANAYQRSMIWSHPCARVFVVQRYHAAAQEPKYADVPLHTIQNIHRGGQRTNLISEYPLGLLPLGSISTSIFTTTSYINTRVLESNNIRTRARTLTFGFEELFIRRYDQIRAHQLIGI